MHDEIKGKAGSMCKINLEKARNVLQLVWHVVRSALEHFTLDQGTIRAASLAYYGLLSLFPLLLFLVFLASQVLKSNESQVILHQYLNDTLPGAAKTVEGVFDQTLRLRGSIGLIGGLGLLWSASAFFNALSISMNAIWGAKLRPFWRRRMIAAGSVLIIGVLFLLSISLSAIAVIPLPGLMGSILRWFNRSVGLGLTILLFWVLYTAIPNKSVHRRSALAGAFIAGLLWQGAKSLFAWYLASGLTNYGAVYGSLASVIALLLWAYFSAQILFLGAEFGAVIEYTFFPSKAGDKQRDSLPHRAKDSDE